MHTFAEGLATRTACALTQEILWEHLDDFVLVAEDELRTCTLRMISSRATWSSRRGPRRSRRRYACASAWRANASR